MKKSTDQTSRSSQYAPGIPERQQSGSQQPEGTPRRGEPHEDEATLRLQPHLQEAAKKFSSFLEERLGQLTLAMGGGSILAARYAHRKSTDIDLWLPREPKSGDDEALQDLPPSDRMDRLRGGAWAGGVPERVTEERIEGVFHAVPVSVKVPPRKEFPDVGTGRGTVEGTSWRAQTTEQILWGKLQRTRVAMLPVRDLYDLAVISAIAGENAETAIASMDAKDREEAIAALRYADVVKEKPLIDAMWTMDERAGLLGLKIAMRTGEASRLRQAVRCKRRDGDERGAKGARKRAWDRG